MTPQFRRRLVRLRAIVAKVALLAALLAVAEVAAQTGDIALPAAQTEGGKPLMQALRERRSTRSFADRPLARQTLSNLLWAALGVNRPDGRRTAPSARNWQEIDVYVALSEGLFVYDAGAHALRRVLAQDVRALAGTQAHAREAPVTLVYVADERRMGHADEETRRTYAAADTGFVAQNVYLFCASEGLATVVFASIDRDRFARAANLSPSQRITLAQSVGFPQP
jgi:SagB-type dehydrogenase family enzyme